MSEKKRVDVAVIGSGPGGYVAAIRASEMGKSVALIEKNLLGGTCLNVGCIPSKALLSSAAVLHQIKKASDFGISTGPVSFEYKKMKEKKDQVVTKMRSGLQGLLKGHKIDVIHGSAQFESPKLLKVLGDNPCFVEADKVIIATGSVPLEIGAFPSDEKRILNSTSALELIEVPKTLVIVGGGYIGCEFASLFLELGTKVIILEALPSILMLQGPTIAGFMTKSFSSRGVDIQTNAQVQGIENKGGHVIVTLKEGKTIQADYALVSVGRKVYTEGLKIEKAGLKPKERGMISVNDKMETDVKGIYAIGDVTGKSMLAHVASHQGIVAASNAAGEEKEMHYHAVPAVVFTHPEIATVGYTLEEAKKAGYDPIEGTFPFMALGKAVASDETEGFCQVIADKKTNQILGSIVIGHEASNLIAEMTLAIQNELTLESVMDTIHAHPTMGESWHEAAGLALNMPINFPRKKK